MGTTVKKLDVRITADNSKLKSGLKQSTQSVNNFSSSLKKMGGVLAGAFAVTKVASFFKSTIKLYGIQEQAEKKLADSIAATGGEVDKLLPRYKRLASEIQGVTTVGDEVTLGLIALGKQMGISDAKMEEATKGAIGLSKAFGIDLNTSMKMVAAGIQGDTTLLNRYIPQLRFATTQAEKMSIMNTAMANGWVVATGEAETFTGKMEQLSNTVGDIKERIGGVIAETMTQPLSDLSTWITENQDGIIVFFTTVAGSVIKLAQATQGLSAAFAKSFTQIAESGINEYIAEQKELIKANSEALGKYRQEQIETFKASILEPFAVAQKNVNDTASEMILTMFGVTGAVKKTNKEVKKTITNFRKLATVIPKGKSAIVALEKPLSDMEQMLEEINEEFENMPPLVSDVVTAFGDLGDGAALEIGNLTELWKAFNEGLLGTEDILPGLSFAFDELGGLIGGSFGSALEDTAGVLLKIASGDYIGAVIAGFNLLKDPLKKVGGWLTRLIQGPMREMIVTLEKITDGIESVIAATIDLSNEGVKDMNDPGERPPGATPDTTPAPTTPIPTSPRIPGTVPVGFASGANFVVPQGFDNDTFPMRVSTGEHVTVTPQGQTGGSTTNINVEMHPAAGASGSDLMQEFIQGYRLNLHNVQGEIG